MWNSSEIHLILTWDYWDQDHLYRSPEEAVGCHWDHATAALTNWMKWQWFGQRDELFWTGTVGPSTGADEARCESLFQPVGIWETVNTKLQPNTLSGSFSALKPQNLVVLKQKSILCHQFREKLNFRTSLLEKGCCSQSEELLGHCTQFWKLLKRLSVHPGHLHLVLFIPPSGVTKYML